MTRLTERPALSIVVPTVDDTAALEETLVSVLENRPDDCEIIVPIACRYDDPWNIGEEVRFVVAPPHAGLAACTNLGVAASRGRVIHVLAAGWRATHGWADAALACFDAASDDAAVADVAAVVPLVVDAREPTRVVSVGVRLSRGGRRVRVAPAGRRSRLDGRGFDASTLRPSAPRLEAGFWRADVLAAAGAGFATTCGDTWCDADMGVTIEVLEGRVVVAADSRVVAGDVRPEPTAFMRGLQAERVFWRSLAQRPLLTSVVCHAWEVVRSALAAAPLGIAPMVVGRLVGLMQFGGYFAHARRVQAVRAAATTGVADGPATVRIDGPHVSRQVPHVRRRGEPPLRKSA
jgi:hypothetical protein